VRDVDEGMEILTGTKAGKRLKSGKFPKDSINGRVQARLEQLAKGVKEFERKEEKKKEAANDNKSS
jgi:hypothetical protein